MSLRCATLMLLYLVAASSSTGLAQDDDGPWTGVRGSDAPGVFYDSFVEAPSGRLLVLGEDGQLMFSDDGGITWDYNVIFDQGGQTIKGQITDMVVFEGQLIGVLLDFVPSNNRFDLPLEGRTRLLTSVNNGVSWQVENFPVQQALFDGFPYPGILLPRLFVSPAGELLAYGTTAIGGVFLMYYRGGAVFRRLGPGSWEQSFFELGPLSSMAEADGRLVATGFQAVIDSPDGRAWGGYLHRDGAFQVDGMNLPSDVTRSLIGSDVAFLNGQYVMQTQALTPAPSRPRLFTTKVDKAFIFESGNPFDGGRLWTGTQQTQIFPNWLEVGNSVLSLSPAGAYRSSNGTSWTLTDDTVKLFTRSLGPVGVQSVVAVGNSREVWRSDNGGGTWTKLLDLPEVPSVNLLGAAGGVLFAQVCDFSCDELYASFDNGVSWSPLADLNAQTGAGINDLVEIDGRLFAVQGFPAAYSVSDDGGANWTPLPTPFSGASDLIEGVGGRLIRPSGGRSGLTGLGTVYTSDDGGLTWDAHDVENMDSQPMKTGVHTGDGRILILYNAFGGIDPGLFVSDDNGETWRRENPFQGLPLLGTVSGSTDTTIELEKIVRLASGRLVILGEDGELLTSDDRGESWTVRLKFGTAPEPDETFLDWTVYDIAEAPDRLVVPASRRDAQGGPDIYFAFVSEDDGNSWREVPIPTDRALRFASTGLNGRVVLSGSNGNVFISDFDTGEASGGPQEFIMREGETRVLPVPRPPEEQAITLRYELLPVSADPDIDYIADTGELTWAADDLVAKSLAVTALEDSESEPDEVFRVRFSAVDGPALEFSYELTIDDNEPGEQAGIDLIGADRLVTTEGGGTTSFRVALATQPSADVTVAIEHTLSSELLVTPTTLIFSAAEWNVAQTVTVSGVDETERDGNVSVRLFLRATSDDVDYADLPGIPVYVVNVDDDDGATPPIFADGFEASGN